MNHDEIISFISTLRESDPYITTIYMQGGCYQFHLVLKSLESKAVPVVSLLGDHVASAIGGRCYDIRGEALDAVFKAMSDEDIEEAKTWSFSGHQMLQVGECPACEEPLLA